MATKPKRPRDVNQLAKPKVDISTGEVEESKTLLAEVKKIEIPRNSLKRKTSLKVSTEIGAIQMAIP